MLINFWCVGVLDRTSSYGEPNREVCAQISSMEFVMAVYALVLEGGRDLGVIRKSLRAE